MTVNTELYVNKYGEQYRTLIEDSGRWLETQEWAKVFTDKDVETYYIYLVNEAKLSNKEK